MPGSATAAESALARDRARLDADLAILRENEAKLRLREKRLREMQAAFEPGSRQVAAKSGTRAPIGSRSAASAQPARTSAELDAEWAKLIRARELFELEQGHLRGDRIALRDETAVVRRRAQAVAEREARVAERERLLREAERRNPGLPQPETSAATAGPEPIFASLGTYGRTKTRSPLPRAKA